MGCFPTRIQKPSFTARSVNVEQCQKLLFHEPQFAQGFFGNPKSPQMNNSADEGQIRFWMVRGFRWRQFKPLLQSRQIHRRAVQFCGHVRQRIHRASLLPPAANCKLESQALAARESLSACFWFCEASKYTSAKGRKRHAENASRSPGFVIPSSCKQVPILPVMSGQRPTRRMV